MELYELYREDGTPTGETRQRGEMPPEGLYRPVADVVVRHWDGTHLVTRRALEKDTYPGLWAASAGGMVQAGETFAMGARRELREETGLEAASLEPMYRILDREAGILFVGFLCTTRAAKDNLRLQPGEVMEYRWLDRRELLKLAASDQFVSTLRQRLGPYLRSLQG